MKHIEQEMPDGFTVENAFSPTTSLMVYSRSVSAEANLDRLGKLLNLHNNKLEAGDHGVQIEWETKQADFIAWRGIVDYLISSLAISQKNFAFLAPRLRTLMQTSPSLANLEGLEKSGGVDALEHSLSVGTSVATDEFLQPVDRFILRFVGLFHDAAKPYLVVPEGRVEVDESTRKRIRKDGTDDHALIIAIQIQEFLYWLKDQDPQAYFFINHVFIRKVTRLLRLHHLGERIDEWEHSDSWWQGLTVHEARGLFDGDVDFEQEFWPLLVALTSADTSSIEHYKEFTIANLRHLIEVTVEAAVEAGADIEKTLHPFIISVLRLVEQILTALQKTALEIETFIKTEFLPPVVVPILINASNQRRNK